MTKIAILASDAPEAIAAAAELRARYGDASPEDADVIVALGGDGLMLQTLHAYMSTGKPIYGMNRGSVGFLMNEYRPGRAAWSASPRRRPRRSTRCSRRVVDADGERHDCPRHQRGVAAPPVLPGGEAADHRRRQVRLEELICDGVLLATPAGSTAYNLSAHGPILPINAPLLALTPISAFRPRRWRGALLPDRAKVDDHGAGSGEAPGQRGRRPRRVQERGGGARRGGPRASACLIMFDRDHSWDERILAEQFRY